MAKSIVGNYRFSVNACSAFFVDGYFIYWLELAGSALLFIIAISLVMGLVNPERGTCSVLKFCFRAMICVSLAILFLYKGLSGLGYW